jgi:DNA-binding IclR family transcriptional regulator
MDGLKGKVSAARRRASEPRSREVPAVTRAIAILRLLGRADEPLGVNAIARALGLIPSTCLHILRVLVAEEFVAFDPVTKRYRLDAGILTVARSVMRRNSFSEVVQPALNRLSERYGVTAIGVQVIGLSHMVVVAISRSELPLRLHVDIGSRFPALISATGRCLAAFGGHSWKELERRFRILRWDQPPSFATWQAEVRAVRENGYSIDQGNYIRGVTVLAVPVLDAEGLMSHSIVAVGVGAQIDETAAAALAREMRSIADSISTQLGTG